MTFNDTCKYYKVHAYQIVSSILVVTAANECETYTVF